MRTLLALILLSCGPTTAALAAPDPPVWWRDGGPRVRPFDARVATLLRSGLDRSPTLRALVDRVEDANVIVYLELHPKLQGKLAGCLTWVAGTEKYRYLRASINPGLAPDQQIAAIAHELQHVVEIIDHPEVDRENAMTGLYRRIGEQRRTGPSAWDTAEAREVGTLVSRELLSSPVSRTALLASAVTLVEWHTWYLQQRGHLYQ
jgi:hypothetical protein